MNENEEKLESENLESNDGDHDEVEVVEASPPHVETGLNAAQKNAEVEREMRALSRRSFLWGAVAAGSTYSGWRWLISRRDDDGIPWPFRHVLENNEQLARDYFKTSRLAPTFSKTAISKERTNGDIGLGDDFDPKCWKLRLEGLANDEGAIELSLKQIKALPRVEMVTEMKCIEGWSIVVQWAGARLVDLMKKYPPATNSGDKPNFQKLDDLPQYVGMATPGGEYYVGLERESALHPQTLLCYEMNGKPLTLEHGAPLRLVVPVKYGVKNIKRIGLIQYSNRRPKDYWAEQGYDWYAGF